MEDININRGIYRYHTNYSVEYFQSGDLLVFRLTYHWCLAWEQFIFILFRVPVLLIANLFISASDFVKETLYFNLSSLKPFRTYSLKGDEGGRGFVGPLPKIFVMRGPIDLRFGTNVNWNSNFHLIQITCQLLVVTMVTKLIERWWLLSWINFRFLRFCLKLRDIIRNG